MRRDVALQSRQDKTGLDSRSLGVSIDVDDLAHVARCVEHDAGADCVACDRRAATAHRHGYAKPARDVVGRDDILDMAREGDDLGHHTVVRRVRGILRPPPRRGVDLAIEHALKLSGERVDGGVSIAFRCHGHARILPCPQPVHGALVPRENGDAPRIR